MSLGYGLPLVRQGLEQTPVQIFNLPQQILLTSFIQGIIIPQKTGLLLFLQQ